MSVNLNQMYFMMSVRFDKRKPEDFGLIQSNEDSNILLWKTDNSKWIKTTMYDFGWGNEFGYMRLPKLEFDDLWDLLLNSHIRDNTHGAAQIIMTEHPDQLLEYLVPKLRDPTFHVTTQVKIAMQLLKLNEGYNRSIVLNKSDQEISADYEKWQWLQSKLFELLHQ